MSELTPSQKGAAAEAEITAAAMRLDVVVLRPLCDGRRYDLVLDIGGRLLRIQCKWASCRGDALVIRCFTSRHTPRGYVRTTYSRDEVDAIGVYSPDTDECYLLPIEEAAGFSLLHLRLAPARNNQAQGVRWAKDYELETSMARNWGIPISTSEARASTQRAVR